MACASCGTGGCVSAGGCQNKGLCASGSCNKMNSYDWITILDLEDPVSYNFVEVSFKNGARKEFYKNPHHLTTGDTVLVEVQGGGYDIGIITLSGELVRLQLKKKFTTEDRVSQVVIRKANERDLEKLENKTQLEKETMVQARAIARSLGLEIKIGDVEFQGDMKKATFFFTANGRVDFRELVRAYAKEFKVKIEMRQIGSRQESARIGGIGSCGRELCCSTWLSDFRSVNTTVARYQNIAINQTKLSGQCGRLKCCLNYELDAYLDALKHFPTHANVIRTRKGNASLVKTDIFKGIMYYAYDDITMRGVFHPLDKEKVKEALDLNKKGILPEDLTSFTELKEEQKEIGFADVTGEIELPNNKKKKKKGGRKEGDGQRRPSSDGNAASAESGNPRENKGGPRSGNQGNKGGGQQRDRQPADRQGAPRSDAQPGQQRAEKQNRPPRIERPEQTDRQDRRPRPDSPERTDRQERPPRPDGPVGQEKPVSQDKVPGQENKQSPDGDKPNNPPKKNFKKKNFFNKNKPNNNP
ncbi:MAG: hypothetical protein IPN29_20175 [Saprospiraceae bacterium]|nr:hypothetical protein [Saprospiraceae bacterium]